MTITLIQAATPIYVGATPTVRVVFRNASTNAPFDPTSVEAHVKSPAGVITTYTYGGGTVTKNSTGDYQVAFTVGVAGDWLVRWSGVNGTANIVELYKLVVERDLVG